MDIVDIKNEVLSRIKAIQKYKKIPEKKIIERIEEIPISEFKPCIITEDRELVDKESLFGRKVSEIIDFLSEYKDYVLEERWSGYEDNYFMFVTNRTETTDEIIKRIYSSVNEDCHTLLKKVDEIADIDEQIRKLENRKRKLLLQ